MKPLYIVALVLLIIGIILLIWGFFELFSRQDSNNPKKTGGLLIAIGSALLFVALILAIIELWASRTEM